MKHIKGDFRSKACVSPPGDLGVGSKDHNSTFSEHGQVAYQIKKKNIGCSNMVANILPTYPPYTPYIPRPLGLGQ